MGIIIKNSVKTTIINYIGVIVGAISILYIQTEFLEASQIGLLNILMDVCTLILPFILFGTGNVASKYFHFFDKNSRDKNAFLSFIFIVPFFIFFVFCLFFLAGHQWFFKSIYEKNELLREFYFLIPILLFSHTYITIIESYLSTLQKIIIPTFLRNIFVKVLIIIIILAYAFKYISFQTLIFLYVGAHSLHLILIYIHLKLSLDFKIQFNKDILTSNYLKEIIIFCSVLIIGSGSGAVINQIDTLMTNGMLEKGPQMVAIYKIAFFLAILVEIPKRSIVQISIPILAKMLSKNEINEVKTIYKKSALNLAIVSLYIFGGIWLCIDEIYKVIPNSNIYEAGKWVVFFIGLSKVFDLSLGLNTEIIYNSKFYKWNIILMPFLGALAIITNYIFIPMYGIIGTAIATAISILLYNIIRCLLVYWKLKILPFDIKQLIALIVSVALYVVINYFLTFNNPYISIFIKSVTFSLLFFIFIYKLNLSQDITNIIDMGLSKIKSIFRTFKP